MVDVCPGVGPCICEDLLDDVGGHLLEQVRRIVCLQVVDDAGGLLLGEGLDDVLLGIQIELGEDIRSLVLWQDPEHLQRILVLHVVHDGGDIGILHVLCGLPELCVLLGLEKFPEEFLVSALFFSRIHFAPLVPGS